MLDISLKTAAWLGGGLLVLAAVAGIHHQGFQEGYAKRSSEEALRTEARQDVVIAKQASVIATNQAEDNKAHEVDQHAQAQFKAALADRDHALSALAGLRDELDAVRADAMSQTTTRAQLAAELAAASDGLSECSARYTALAGGFDSLSVQVTGLLALAPEAP